jgi:N-acetyl sugar amidotransferase
MNIKNNTDVGKYGLPKEVKYCVKCNVTNQRPTSTNEYRHDKDTLQIPISFDKNDVCHACKTVEKKWDGSIDWEEREKELIDLCDKHKNIKGQYNCLIGGSGGKDSAFQSHVLKYKYGMRPLTITWAPHIYTDIGWKNFQNWINIGGFDNYLFTPNGKIHRYLTRRAVINLLHPFQPFIIGQKNFTAKLAYLFDIPLIFYGEPPSDYGTKLGNIKQFSKQIEESHPGFTQDPISSMNIKDVKLGGDPISYYVDQGFDINDFECYFPLDINKFKEKKIETYFLGYYLKWIPQENFYYAVENTGFQANTERTEGTYQKYASIDDKTDGFFYYTSYIKFGCGRAMLDSSMEVRNGHITKEEGLGLIKQFDGEFPKKYEKEFLEYISMTREEFDELCDKFRPNHIWEKKSNRWELKNTPWEYFDKKNNS